MLRLHLAVLASLGVTALAENMNGKYAIASGSRQNVAFNDDYASKGHEYFDVYTKEIATHYSETYWINMGTTAFPPEIVERFKGKVMAITGERIAACTITRLAI